MTPKAEFVNTPESVKSKPRLLDSPDSGALTGIISVFSGLHKRLIGQPVTRDKTVPERGTEAYPLDQQRSAKPGTAVHEGKTRCPARERDNVFAS
jgi:hypothetical protein